MQEKWLTRFLNVAAETATWSKDQSSKVGCVIVDDQLTIRATGYNGIPRNVNDDVAERHERPLKYQWFNHAEANAIANCARLGIRTENCSIFITHPPCSACTRSIIQAGIVEIAIDSTSLSLEFMDRWGDDYEISQQMLLEAGVSLVMV